jgi:hypothetical protein
MSQVIRPRAFPGLEPGDDLCPGAVALPAPEQVVDPLPRATPLEHIPPGSTGPGPPPYAGYQLLPRPHPWTARLDALRQRRLHCSSVRSPRAITRDHFTFKIYFCARPEWGDLDAGGIDR